eukprot:6206957-Pleurochrysis_carterae.AAC.1
MEVAARADGRAQRATRARRSPVKVDARAPPSHCFAACYQSAQTDRSAPAPAPSPSLPPPPIPPPPP